MARLEPFTDIFLDPSRTATIQEILSPAGQDSFFANPRPNRDLNYGFTDSAVWLRFSLRNACPQERTWLVEIAYPLLDDVTVYVADGSGTMTVTVTGDTRPFAQRPLDNRNFVLPLEFKPDETKTVHVRVVTTGATSMPLTVMSPHGFHAIEQDALLSLGIYYGMILAMACFNIWLFFSTGDRVFLHYVVWITAYMLIQATLNGLSYQYLWPDWPWWESKAMSVLMGLAVCGMSLFTLAFMVGASISPGWRRFLKLCSLIGALSAPAALLVPDQPGLMFTSGLSQVAIATILVISIQGFHNGFRPAGLFGLAWSTLLVGLLVGIARTWGWLPSNFVTRYCYQFGSAIEVVLLSLALSDRIRRISDERRVLRETSRKFLELSLVDALTGLYNKRHLEERLTGEYTTARADGLPLSLLVLDVDDFKHFNDTHGHAAGDHVLRTLSQVMRDCLRRVDIPCRFGGEEFVVLLPGTDIQGAIGVGERIRERFAAHSFEASQDLPASVTVSLGASELSPQDPHGQALFDRADKALYRAKAAGKNRLEAA